MEVEYAPEGLAVGDQITIGRGRWAGTCAVIAIGKGVVVVRDKSGWTRTLLRKRVSHPARNRPWKKPSETE